LMSFDEDDEIKIYAEMPGVTKESIKLDLEGDILNISAKGGERNITRKFCFPERLRLIPSARVIKTAYWK